MRLTYQRAGGFTLVELLVVVGMLAALLGILLPTLGRARASADTLKCVSNLRNLQAAHVAYMTQNGGRFPRAGHAAQGTWLETLKPFYGDVDAARRCPSDRSKLFDTPFPGTPPRLRTTSYGVNNLVGPRTPAPGRRIYLRMEAIPQPAATIYFVELAETDSPGVSDHVHPENWYTAGDPNSPLTREPLEIQLHRHGRKPRTWEAMSNYSFLDGHVETLPFGEVYRDLTKNKFNPALAR